MAARLTILFLIVSALSACTRTAPPVPWSPATPPLGIVLLHGKGGSAGYLADTRSAFEAQGYLVATPEMCWSARRMYDRTYPECLSEIDTAVANLRQRGARSIVVAGHSLGGTAAVVYGATHDGIAGVIGYASGDAYFGPPSGLPDIARARSLVAEGKGDVVETFKDISPGGTVSMRTTAVHFLSFVSLAPSETMIAQASHLRAPVLFVAGTRDVATLQYAAKAYQNAPGYARNRFLEVPADHAGTLSAGMAPVVDWLAKLM
jgi:pimeloyl-ACP methyl ester carboxylesterase